ncbi:hypothetical protein [Indioceanicola profundi]|uniref:hypothetical protein n=1 Tax=Indioceanicola profundi TaxID=2220096 RepID=UPI000E6AABC5|nr:hypothetical protein [Indioceanicola profundi]
MLRRLTLLPLLALLPLAACGSDDPQLAEAQEITDRPIAEIVGSDQVKLTKFLSRRRMSCPEMYGVAADRAGSEFLLLCADEVTPEMLEDFTSPGWTVHSVFLTTQEVRPGNHTRHCAPVPSTRDVCDRL